MKRICVFKRRESYLLRKDAAVHHGNLFFLKPSPSVSLLNMENSYVLIVARSGSHISQGHY